MKLNSYRKTENDWYGLYLSIYLSNYLSIYISIYLSIYPWDQQVLLILHFDPTGHQLTRLAGQPTPLGLRFTGQFALLGLQLQLTATSTLISKVSQILALWFFSLIFIIYICIKQNYIKQYKSLQFNSNILFSGYRILWLTGFVKKQVPYNNFSMSKV